MSSLDQYLKKGKDAFASACQADNEGDNEQALKLYLIGLNWFEMARKYGPTAEFKKGIENTMIPYIERAELIKAQIASEKQEQLSGIGSDDNDNGDKDEDRKSGISNAIMKERPNVKLDDVIGLEAAKAALLQAVLVPLEAPQLLHEGATWKGILLYGPPGTGKSFLAKAIAGESKSTFFSLSASDLISKWLGESEKIIKDLFKTARENKPSIIFVDEVETVLATRSDDGASTSAATNRAVSEFLVQLQGVGSNNDGVLFLAATNLPWSLDSGARRRMEKTIYIPLPDEKARKKMIFRGIAKLSADLSNDDELIQSLVEYTNGFSGSDIQTALKDASMATLQKTMDALYFKRDPREEGTFIACTEEEKEIDSTFREFKEKKKLRNPPLTRDDVLQSFHRTKATVAQADLAKYEEWTEEFGTRA